MRRGPHLSPMPQTSYDLRGVRVFACPPDGEKLRNDRDAVNLIAEASQVGAELILIPAERFDDEFFRLQAGIAGEILQKFVTYRMRVAIVGDLSRHVDASTALRDFVYESNRGNHIWFVANIEELGKQLERAV